MNFLKKYKPDRIQSTVREFRDSCPRGYSVAEQFHRYEGASTLPLKKPSKVDFKKILDGERDDIPESCFLSA